MACRFGRLRAAELLLAFGADPSADCAAGDAALALALRYGHAKVARVLLENGAQPGQRNLRTWVPAEQEAAGSEALRWVLARFAANPVPRRCVRPIIDEPEKATVFPAPGSRGTLRRSSGWVGCPPVRLSAERAALSAAQAACLSADPPSRLSRSRSWTATARSG